MAAQFPDTSRHTRPSRPVSDSFGMFEIELPHLLSVVKNLDGIKATGLDNITVKLIKNNIDILAVHLLHMFRHWQDCGTYRNELKLGKVVPVYKDGDGSSPSSYRPISVLSVINTIFEKILSTQITSFASKHSIICRNQHGFRSHRSTSSAVLVLTQQVNKALSNNKLAVVVFLDIRKAFDSVNHSILLAKLYDYGFRGRIHKLLKCYLSDRQQRVVIDGFVSSAESVVAGIPQGSVIGPSLFSLYVNDFPSVLLYSEALM